jgi:hypothetical protein
MAEGASSIDYRHRARSIAPWLALAVVVVGVFSTCTTAGRVTLNGVQGPNDGWLVVIVAALACAWAAMMRRRGWSGGIGVLGVLGASAVIVWTAVESWADGRRVLDASAGHGLILVLGGAVLLAAAATYRGVELLRSRTRPTPVPKAPA